MDGLCKVKMFVDGDVFCSAANLISIVKYVVSLCTSRNISFEKRLRGKGFYCFDYVMCMFYSYTDNNTALNFAMIN